MSSTVVIVTGASRGIGLATAIRFAQSGAKVAISARSADTLDTAAEQVRQAGGECVPVAGDVSDSFQARHVVDTAVAAFGHVNVLVNNAGVAPLVPIDEMTDDQYRTCIGANIDGTFWMTRAVWPHLRTAGGGVIVNLSSIGAIDPFPGFAVYGASKAWAEKFTAATATEGKPHNLRAYAVGPGGTDTQMLHEALPDYPADQILPPEAIAATIHDLCGPTWQHSSGQTIYVRR